MNEPKTLRRDARENMSKLCTAALEVFLAKGLGAPLEEIASTAGVSIGTLYNRFGSREALIDAVIPEVVASKLEPLTCATASGETARERLEAFICGMIDLQVADPALNDAILRRYPEAVTLVGVCQHSLDFGRALVREAHKEGSLSLDFTEDDLSNLLWLAGVASRSANAPSDWRRIITFALESAWISPPAGNTAVHPPHVSG